MKTRIGNRVYGDHTYIMGILNVTPDSFSDGGRYTGLDAALYHAEQMLREGADILDVGGESTFGGRIVRCVKMGADILDVGGESTRPGYTRISDEEEISRITPVIEAIRARLDIPVSADTYKPAVAAAALQAGADMINDIWGFQAEPGMAEVVAQAGAACCLMHNRKEPVYDSFFEDVLSDLRRSIALAKAAGIPDDRILLDGGVGFAKSREQNLEIIRRGSEIAALGYPVLLGTSRKSVIGLTLDVPVDQRLEGTLATTVVAVMTGCQFVRVHDVLANRRAVDMTEAILGKERQDG